MFVVVSAVLLGTSAGQTAPSSKAPSAKTKKPAEKIRVEEGTGSLIVRAESAIEKHDYAAAEPLLMQAIAEDAKDYRAWYDLGFVLNVTGRKADAIAAYRKSVEANPQLFESTYDLGLLLAQMKDPEAEKFLRAATTLKPSAANPNERLARAWISLGMFVQDHNPADALKDFAEAARLASRDPEPHLFAGALLERKGQLAEAENEYRAAMDLDPHSVDAALGLVNVYQNSQQLPQAEAALRKYLELEPKNAAAHIKLARVLAARHKRFDAIAEYEAGMKLAPQSEAVQRELADMYVVGNHPAKAEGLYRELVKRNPNDAAAHAGLGHVLMHEKQPVEAQSELLAALKLDPTLVEAYNDLAFTANENKNYELTIRVLDARAKLAPESPATYFLRATAYDHLHLPKQAAEYYRQFLQIAAGRFPDEEWKAEHRLKAIAPEKK